MAKTAFFPLHIVAHHPGALALNSAGFGMLWRIVMHYWLTDCRPLPETDGALFCIARAHKPTWFANRTELKAILADILPELARQAEIRAQKMAQIRRIGQKGHSVMRARTLQKQALIGIEQTATPIQPKSNAREYVAPSIGGNGFRETG